MTTVTTTHASSNANAEVEQIATEDHRREMIDLRVQLDRERRHRMNLEEHVRTLESQAYQVKEVRRSFTFNFYDEEAVTLLKT